MKTANKILLTFNGFQDPYNKDSSDGPILTLLKERADFNCIILFYTKENETNTLQTARLIQDRYNIKVDSHPLIVDDPTNHEEILRNLRQEWRKISEDDSVSEYYISVASGTPAMHACWLLLSAGGDIPANILYIRPEKFVKEGQPRIAEINPRTREFPHILPKILAEEVPGKPNIEEAIRLFGIVGDHPKIKDCLHKAAIYADYDRQVVLILGETGTGKELVAKFIHHISKRGSLPILVLNCGGISEPLVHSELFGHMKGAFSGAVQNRQGAFEAADGGTLFLDEIGDLPPSIQSEFLRVIQFHEIKRLGENEVRKVDVRIIAATHRDLKKEVKDGRFRQDLFQRLNELVIELPPLRERKSDIPKIALHLLNKFNKDYNHSISLSQQAERKLQDYSWPGNVRELKNVVIRAAIGAIESAHDEISANDVKLPDELSVDFSSSLPEPYEGFSLKTYQEQVTNRLYNRALELSSGNKAKAARLLGVSQAAVSKFLEKNKSNHS